RCVKVDDAPIYELHHGNGCKHLAHRADAEHRGVGWHLAGVATGQAEALAPNDALVIHEGDRDCGGALIDELLRSGLPFLNRSTVARPRRLRTAGGKKECRRGGKEECPHARSGCDTTQILTRLRPRLVNWVGTRHHVTDPNLW